MAASSVRRIYACRWRIESTALSFTPLNPVTLDGYQFFANFMLTNIITKKILLNFFDSKGRTSKLPPSYLLGISLVITKVKTLDFI